MNSTSKRKSDFMKESVKSLSKDYKKYTGMSALYLNTVKEHNSCFY